MKTHNLKGNFKPHTESKEYRSPVSTNVPKPSVPVTHQRQYWERKLGGELSHRASGALLTISRDCRGKDGRGEGAVPVLEEQRGLRNANRAAQWEPHLSSQHAEGGVKWNLRPAWSIK